MLCGRSSRVEWEREIAFNNRLHWGVRRESIMDGISNGWILTTQIIPLVVFVLALFSVYRLLVANKDSVIELLRERVTSLI